VATTSIKVIPLLESQTGDLKIEKKAVSLIGRASKKKKEGKEETSDSVCLRRGKGQNHLSAGKEDAQKRADSLFWVDNDAANDLLACKERMGGG